MRALEIFAVVATPAVVVAAVSRAFPNLWHRRVAAPRARKGWVKRAHAAWPRICDENRLNGSITVQRKVKETFKKRGQSRTRWVIKDELVITSPKLVDVVYRAGILTLTITPRGGQRFTDLRSVAESISDTFGGLSHRAIKGAHAVMTLEIIMVDHLGESQDATMPKPAGGRPVPKELRLGWREDGRPWVERLTHTLIAGRSRSGKASAMWAYLCQLAPWVATGHVILLGIDLKGGTELKMGAGMFREMATKVPEAILLLQRLVDEMDDRADKMAGHAREHIASLSTPTIILCIDELASLTKYSTAAQGKEVDRLLPMLLSKGAGLGVIVIGCMQDPRKDVLGYRNLFLRFIALALESPTETEMVLGTRQALAHEIPESAPGVGFVIDPDRSPVKVRAYYWTNALLRAVAREFPPLRTQRPDPTPTVPRQARRGTAEHNAALAKKAAQAAEDKAALADLESQIGDVDYGDFGEAG